MIALRVLTRGVAGPKALAVALNELRIQNGEEFALVRYSPRVMAALARVVEKIDPPEELSDSEFEARLIREFDGTVEES